MSTKSVPVEQVEWTRAAAFTPHCFFNAPSAQRRSLLGALGWTRYRLAKELGMTEPALYRLAQPGRAVARIDARTLEKLCEVFGVQPGELLEWVPDRERKRKRGRR